MITTVFIVSLTIGTIFGIILGLAYINLKNWASLLPALYTFLIIQFGVPIIVMSLVGIWTLWDWAVRGLF